MKKDFKCYLIIQSLNTWYNIPRKDVSILEHLQWLKNKSHTLDGSDH